MAEEERISTPAADEAAASAALAAAATASGPSAEISSDTTSIKDDPKAMTVAAAAAAAAAATDGNQQKQQQQQDQGGESAPKSHAGTGKQRRRNKTKNNNYSSNTNTNNYANPNRPGAYAPVTAPDRAARRSALVGALTPQLEYYFSPANLFGDTYLKTLMDLNSGHVPVGVIANFGNVQRIVVQWDGADGTGGVVGQEPSGVHSLIREAADRSALLDVVWIDGSGRKVADGDANDKSGGVDNGAAAGEEAKKKAQTGNKGGAGGAVANRIAIGPKNAGGVTVGGGVMAGATSTAIATPQGQQLPQKQNTTTTTVPGQSVVILRDAPAATTSDDIRSVFTSAKASVTAIHSDVGNTWFVTLDGDKTNRDDVITLLLSLRGMKLHGEPIKARLKAESVAARFPVGPGGSMAGSGYAASAPQSPVAAKFRSTDTGGHRQQHQQLDGGSKKVGHGGSGTGSAWDKLGGGGGGGGSRQPHQMRQSRSVPSSPAGRSQLEGGEKTEGKGGKTIAAPNTPGGKPRGGKGAGGDGRDSGAVDGKSTGTKNNNAAAGSKRAKSKASAAIPPPPLVNLHFPALGGEEDGEKKPASQVKHRPKEDAAKKTAPKETGSGESEEAGAENTTDTVTVPSTAKKEANSAGTAPPEIVGKKPVSGYAAALLRTPAPAAAAAPSAVQKVAQPASVSTVGSEGADEKKAAGARGKELKLPPSTGGKGPSSRASIPSTAITDDSSADDKSSVSSKTESLGCVPVVAAVAPSWGGGKTFADVLKKKEHGTAAPEK